MTGDRVGHIWIPVPALLLPCCVTSNKSLPQPEPQCLQLISLLVLRFKDSMGQYMNFTLKVEKNFVI